MRPVVLFLLVTLLGCSKPETPVAPSLVGTKWSTYSYKSVVDGSNVYQMLRFVSATEVEQYYAAEKTKISGSAIEKLPYTYADPNLSVTGGNGKTFAGTVSGNTIRLYERDFTKEP